MACIRRVKLLEITNMSYNPDPLDFNGVQVFVPCEGKYLDEGNVQFEGVSSNEYGEDILHYTCPFCSKVHKSLRYGFGGNPIR